MKKAQWFFAGMAAGIVVLICMAGMNTNAVYLTDDGWYSFGTSFRETTCELCGKAISIIEPQGNNWTFCDTTTFSLLLSELESRESVNAWEFNLTHDLCDECALLANEKIKKPLADKHKELWESLVKLKSEERAECENKRRLLHIQRVNEKIADLREELKELTKPNEVKK